MPKKSLFFKMNCCHLLFSRSVKLYFVESSCETRDGSDVLISRMKPNSSSSTLQLLPFRSMNSFRKSSSFVADSEEYFEYGYVDFCSTSFLGTSTFCVPVDVALVVELDEVAEGLGVVLVVASSDFFVKTKYPPAAMTATMTTTKTIFINPFCSLESDI